MEKKNSLLLHSNLHRFQASQKQLEYFDNSTYDIVTPGGNNYRRNIEFIAFNAASGNMLVREKVLFGDNKYEKIYIVSSEGKAEKYNIA